MSNLNGFLPALPISMIERALIADYLLSQGYLLCELQYLAAQDAKRLYEEARQFARKKASKVLPDPMMTAYSMAGFSLN